jgi:hypothetical protein
LRKKKIIDSSENPFSQFDPGLAIDPTQPATETIADPELTIDPADPAEIAAPIAATESETAAPANELAAPTPTTADDLAPADLPAADIDMIAALSEPRESRLSIEELAALLSNTETSIATTPLSPPPFSQPSDTNATWYLGIDIGTTGISAVLLNRMSCELYPIRWLVQTASNFADPEGMLRLPTLAYLSAEEADLTEMNAAPLSPDRLVIMPIAPTSTATASGLLLRNLKPYLKSGIPHYSPQTQRWEPTLQWSDQQQVPLSWVHQALRSLLAALNCQPAPGGGTASLTCLAIGLDSQIFQTALRQLAGVIVGYPANWSDTYSFNLREVILAAKLVARPEQVCCVEDTIATLLSSLRSADGRDLVLPFDQSQSLDWHNANWRGGTLIVSAGASVTELALVNLPDRLSDLHYRDFAIRSLSYAGNAIDQDIVCQLFYPAWAQSNRVGNEVGSLIAVESSPSLLDPPMEPNALETLGLDDLTLPQPGEPDPINRIRLQQRLDSSPLGRSLLEAARHLKLTLQRRDRFTLRLGDQQWIVTRPELGSQVILPYIQRLNRELNALLSQTGLSALGINQVVCTGGTASLAAIARWLRQKLPNATILQDTYTGDRSPSPQENCLPLCSRVAYGLATVPLHPQVINLPRQQYSDYFLLLELLRSFPDQAVSAREVMQLLERRGINTQSCHLRILALLKGHLPPGLIPTEKDAILFTAESRQNPDYQALLTAPLFIKQADQTYRPNYVQWNHLRRYLDTIMASTHQQLAEPLILSPVK